MLGIIRFFLAFFVLVSHFPDDGMKLNLGVVSVICFYFISGYLMRKSYSRFVKNSSKPVLDFYIDRIIKLYPQYFIVLVISFISVWYFGKSEELFLLDPVVTVPKVILNLLILPVNYIYAPFSLDAFLSRPMIPPAWSLATELHFYLLLPFIFKLDKKRWGLLLLAVLGIQFSSLFFGSGPFNSNNFGYRFIFGVLTVFLYGYSFAEMEDRFFRGASIFIWLMFAFFLFVVTPAFNVWENQFVQEILVGGFIALPVGFLFTSVKMPERFKKIDSLLGDLAYPMFISHYITYYLVEKVLHVPVSNRAVFYMISIAFCLLISYLLSLLQLRVEVYRIARRGFSSLKSMKEGG